MGKVSGKTLSFWFDDLEIPVDQIGFDSDFEELESTDSSTVSPASEFVMNRAKRTISIDQLLRPNDGTEINTGTLTKGTKYRVTAKDTVLAAYDIGEIFTAAGTEVMSATDKVTPISDVIKGKGISMTIGGVAFPVTSITFNQAFGEFDSTDSATVGDATEFISGRRKSTSTLEAIMRAEDADKLDTDPTPLALVITLATSYTLTGTATFKKKGIVAVAKGDMVKVSYDVTWSGEITSTLNTLALGESKAAKIVYEPGTTDKAKDGDVILLNMTITADVNSLVTVNYTGNWVGAVDETEKT